MVKGTKRKIPIEKITQKNSLATCFTKRRDGLYSKASQICLLSGAQIAILATPSSSESNVSFFSFGHSSADAVVSAFLTGHRPTPVLEENKQMREDIGTCLTRKDLGLGFWWEDMKLNESENPEEVTDAIESMSNVLKELRSMKHRQDFNKDVKFVLHQGRKPQELNQTLDNQYTSDAKNVVMDDCVPEINNKKTEDNFSVTDNNKNDLTVGSLDEFKIHEWIESDELIAILSDQSNCEVVEDCLNVNDNTQEQDQTMLSSEIFNFDDLDAGLFRDFEMNCDGLFSGLL